MTVPSVMLVASHMEGPICPISGQWPDPIMQYVKDFRKPRNESQTGYGN